MTPPIDRGGDEAVRRVVQTLPFRRPWSIEGFLGDVGIRLGRLIVVEPLPEEVDREITGLWVPTATRDVIYVSSRATGRYREHIICHEVAHILLAHRAGGHAEFLDYLAENIRRIAPDLPDYLIQRLARSQVCFARSGSALHPVEAEAEQVATLIMTRAEDLRKPLFPPDLPPRDREFLGKIAGLFGWRV
ncbi:hypothetical protein [Millisia brevis]|uniref:hypothetical protein n=1 Tax=Millisia brevis TaxID=264148 RepID=UPI00082D51AC|nr:hypothetical protein [Millisia brevis]